MSAKNNVQDAYLESPKAQNKKFDEIFTVFVDTLARSNAFWPKIIVFWFIRKNGIFGQCSAEW